MYEDDKLPSDEQFSQLEKNYTEKLAPDKSKTNLPVWDEESVEKISNLLQKLIENKQYLEYLNAYMQKNFRYKTAAKQVGLENALQTNEKHINEIMSLGTAQPAQVLPPARHNTRHALYNCCKNQGDILNTLLWFMLFKNTLGQKQAGTMALEQSEILQQLYLLF